MKNNYPKVRKAPSSFRGSVWNEIFAERRRDEALIRSGLFGPPLITIGPAARLTKAERKRLFDMPWDDYKKLKGWDGVKDELELHTTRWYL